MAVGTAKNSLCLRVNSAGTEKLCWKYRLSHDFLEEWGGGGRKTAAVKILISSDFGSLGLKPAASAPQIHSGCSRTASSKLFKSAHTVGSLEGSLQPPHCDDNLTHATYGLVTLLGETIAYTNTLIQKYLLKLTLDKML